MKNTVLKNVDLTTNLVGQALVEFGESIQLNAVVSLPASILDSIAWTNGSLLSCTDCLDPMATPVTQTTFMVTVFKNGCEESDSLTVYVDLGEGQVYVPTAFSPNDDNVNDLFRIYAGPSVTRVKNFFIFDRWGKMRARVIRGEATSPNCDPPKSALAPRKQILSRSERRLSFNSLRNRGRTLGRLSLYSRRRSDYPRVLSMRLSGRSLRNLRILSQPFAYSFE